MSVSTDPQVCSLCRTGRQSRGVEVPRDRRLCRVVKFGVQTDGCQDGCPQPVLGYWSFLSFARCAVTWRGGTGILVGGILLSLSHESEISQYWRRKSCHWCKLSLGEKLTHSPQNTQTECKGIIFKVCFTPPCSTIGRGTPSLLLVTCFHEPRAGLNGSCLGDTST